MNAVIYIRVSTKEQLEGTSLESQELACNEYARAQRLRVLKTFVERGESAKVADRTELLALLDYCRTHKGQVQTLIVWKVDRFARNTEDHFGVKAMLRKYGVEIASVTEPIDRNPEGRLMETILAGFAQFDNDIRAARTTQGMRRKIQEGIFPWKPPLGYKTSRSGREKKNRPDQPDEPRFSLLQKAWQQFATGAYTKAEMRRLMNSWGIVTRRGKPLCKQSIDNLFRNRYYAGILLDPWSGEEHQGLHQPMVSREEFATVQRVISRRNRSLSHQRHREEFPLRGFARCEDCNHYVTGSFSRGRSKRYPYYHCHNQRCSRRGKGIPVAQVHAEFTAYLPEIAPKTELLEKVGETAARSVGEREELLQSRRAQARKTIEQLTVELQELVRLRAQRRISDEEFEVSRTALLAERYAAEADPKPLKCTASEIHEHLREIAEPLHALLDTWTNMLQPLRARFQRLILPVGFQIGKVRTAELGLLFRVFGEFEAGDSTVVHHTRLTSNQFEAEIQALAKLLEEYHASKPHSRRGVRRKSMNPQ